MLEKFRPNEMANGLAQINLLKLKEKGMKGIICDIDNTLVLYSDDVPKASEIEWIEKAKKDFSVILLSNALPRRAAKVSKFLDIPAQAKAIKPSRRGFRKALKVLDLPAQEVVVIGDQLLTDVLGGNRMGLYTILVAPLGSRELLTTKLFRLFERWIKKHLHLKTVDVTTPDK